MGREGEERTGEEGGWIGECRCGRTDGRAEKSASHKIKQALCCLASECCVDGGLVGGSRIVVSVIAHGGMKNANIGTELEMAR